jgi:Fe-Mn family superoxide dismutase
MEKTIHELRNLVVLAETTKNKLTLVKLPYDRKGLEPVMSKATIDYHFSTLAKAYVDRYNSGEGDPKFNEAGAFLHNIFFPQFSTPTGSNRPFGASEDFINKHYKDFDTFKEKTLETAMGIQGSGWVYLAKDGKIKTITNHQIKNDIVLLIDWWEHAWALDYQADKKKYLKNLWRVINWSVINDRLNVNK